MSDVSNDCYLLTETGDSDLDRDLLFHYTFKSILKTNLQCPFDHNMKKCLDIGYSAGYWMMEMSVEFPHCQFYGIDIDSRAPEHVYPRNCLFEKGDFLQGLPYPDNNFDLVHVRMTLFMLSPEQIRFLFAEISRVTKQGGYIEFLELDISTIDSAGPLLNKLLMDIKSTKHVAYSHDLSTMDKMLLEHGFMSTINNDISVPLGKWGGQPGELSITTLKYLIVHDFDLNLHHEDELKRFLESIDQECEAYKPRINVFSGFGQRL